MRALLLAVLVVWSPEIADACGTGGMPRPGADLVGPSVAGRRPWIEVRDLPANATISINQIAATCPPAEQPSVLPPYCKGTPLAFERSGAYLRPRAALPAGSRVQVTMGTEVLADFTVTKQSAPATLPAWSGVSLVSAKLDRPTRCDVEGPVVTLKAKPTKAELTEALLLVYLEKPDPEKPVDKLVHITSFFEESIVLKNSHSRSWMRDVPKRLWVRLADGHGNVGPVIQLP
jgi:hypothetical protein